MTIFGISGKAGSGKDTLALLLKAQLVLKGHSIDKMTDLGFATKLKEAAKVIFGLDKKYFNDQHYKKRSLPEFDGLTPRDILQKLGTEVGRNIFQNIWTHNYIEKINKLRGNYEFIFTTDVRFANELSCLDDVQPGIKVVFIKINRENKLLDNAQSQHASENEILDDETWDCVINNNESLSTLNDSAKLIIQEHCTW